MFCLTVISEYYGLHSSLWNHLNESEITKLLFSKMLGLRKDVNPQLVANMIKIMALSMENRKLLHEKVLTETIQLIAECLCDYMFL